MEKRKHSIAVAIPCYKVKNKIKDVILSVPDFVDYIIAVDDKCPQDSGKIVKEIAKTDKRITVLFHEKNQGVGAALASAYKKALEMDADIVVKIDGDGQMDTSYMQELIDPIINDKADYTKGNRFIDFKALKSMPRIRLFGNSMLSFMLKVSSGYWDIMDPTNGYTAISKKTIQCLNFKKMAKRYFFESDMLVNLNICNKVVKDINIPAKYDDEESSLNIGNIILKFPCLLFRRFCKRIFLKYFVFNFNMASIYTLVGMPMILFGGIFGIYKWVYGVNHHIETPTGTVMLAVLPLFLGVQFILQAISIDINSVPKKE
jgi:dolichol-phosphate mannosyltransferase